MSDRQDHRLWQRPVRHDLLHAVQWAILGMVPGRKHFAVVVQNPGFRHFLFRGDQHQGFAGGGTVFEHHGGFNGIADGARDQMQVMVGIGAQCKQRHQGQEDPRSTHGNQRQPKVYSLQYPAQRRA
ncbi:hypothetical protein D3C72_1433590 [compost metagenome]